MLDVARKNRTPKQKSAVKAKQLFIHGLEAVRSKPKPAATLRVSADPPANVDDAAYQLGASVVWLEFFQRCGWAYGDGECDTNVHLALDSILECVDALKAKSEAEGRLDRVEQLATAARGVWEAEFGSDSHRETVTRLKEASDHDNASKAIKLVMALAPLHDECSQLISAATNLSSKLGKAGLRLVQLGNAVATCETKLHDGSGTAAQARDHLQSLLAACDFHGLPEGVTDPVRVVLNDHPDDEIVIFGHGSAIAVHNAIRQHLAGIKVKKAFTLAKSHKKLLRAMYLYNLVDEGKRRIRAAIEELFKNESSPDRYSHELANLVHGGYVHSRCYKGGGYWLSESGRKAAALYSQFDNDIVPK